MQTPKHEMGPGGDDEQPAEKVGIYTWRGAKRLVILVFGGTLLLFGVLLLLIPGPGILVILFGLGVLSTEFVWARQLLKKVKERSENYAKSVSRWNNKS